MSSEETAAQISHTIRAAALLLAAVQVKLADVAKFGPAGNAVTDRCGEAEFFAAAVADAAEQASKHSDDISSAQKSILRWKLAAAKSSDDNKAKKLTALADFGSVILSRIASNDRTWHNKLSAFQFKASRWTGMLIGLETAAQHTFTLSGTPTRTDSGAKGAGETGPNTLTETACAQTKVKSTFGSGNLQLTLAAIKRIKITTAPEIQNSVKHLPLTLEGTSAASSAYASTGTVLLDSNQGTGFFKTHGSCATKGFKVALGKATPPTYTGSTGTVVGTDENNPKQCRNSFTADDKMIPTADELAHALCEANAVLRATTQLPDDMTADDLAKDTVFQRIVNNLFPPSGKPLDLSNPESTTVIEEHIKQTYGKETGAFRKSFVEAVDAETINYKAGTQSKDNTIKELVGTDDGTIALSHLQQKKLTKIQPPLTAQSPKSRDNCNTETDTDKCNNKPGCKYDDGESKCEKDLAKTTPETTNTNTTGRNSVLINKAPLMLAFFIL
ncbi:uncharacterized protein TEOVI_000478500 [Trypanosoma equiperdum]|uniref:Variant surface glycoprotein (VSG) n=1 Tax=Trypanosoma equiperdum TaxID=5694 RepID=A0A1G4IKM5_TRYEQ|nr:hypothetical protein TEOVI_000478500 [Trypanosoma equiperdum]